MKQVIAANDNIALVFILCTNGKLSCAFSVILSDEDVDGEEEVENDEDEEVEEDDDEYSTEDEEEVPLQPFDYSHSNSTNHVKMLLIFAHFVKNI